MLVKGHIRMHLRGIMETASMEQETMVKNFKVHLHKMENFLKFKSQNYCSQP